MRTIFPGTSNADLPFATTRTMAEQNAKSTQELTPEIKAAVALHTDVYLGANFITDEDLEPNTGLYFDPYFQHSKYFYRAEGDKEATARQIHCHGDDGLLSLPTFAKFACEPNSIAEAYGVNAIEEVDPNKVVEISALSSRKAGKLRNGRLDDVVSLFGEMLKESAEQGHKLWVMNIEERYARHLRSMIPENLVKRIGEEKEYMGPATTPYAINPEQVLRHILNPEMMENKEYKAYFKSVFDGTKSKKMDKELIELFEANDIKLDNKGRLLERLKSPVALGTLAIGAYSMSRPFAAAQLPEFYGNSMALWGIDVATTYPYVKGIALAYGKGSLPKKAIGAGLAIPSFLAPYAYFYMEGENYPGFVNVAVGAFVAGAISKEVISRRRRQRKNQKLSAALKK